MSDPDVIHRTPFKTTSNSNFHYNQYCRLDYYKSSSANLIKKRVRVPSSADLHPSLAYFYLRLFVSLLLRPSRLENKKKTWFHPCIHPSAGLLLCKQRLLTLSFLLIPAISTSARSNRKKKYAASSSKWNDKQQIVEFVRDCKWSKKIFFFKIVIGSFDEIRCLVVLKVLRWWLAIWSFFFHCQLLWETKTAWAESPKYILKCHKKIPNEFQKPPKRRFFSCSAFIPTLSTIWNW